VKDLNIVCNVSKIYNNRSYLSYIFTLKPIFIFYILSKIKLKDFVIYLDSDTYFLGTPSELLKIINNSSIFLTKHNFCKKNIYKEKYGIFNAGFIAFRSDFLGKKYLKKWIMQCIKCCDLNLTKNTWGDQIYLNKFKKNNNNVKFLNTEIFNLGPWNVSNYSISYKENCLFCNNKKVIFFHFQDFKLINSRIALKGLYNYSINLNSIINKLYFHYFLIIGKFSLQYKLKQNILDLKIIKRLVMSFLRKDIFYIKKNN
jgi:hypothetical protein